MLARLGNVLYWAGCLISIVIVGLVLYGIAFGTGQGNPFIQGLLLVIAAGSWLIGRACQYVLSGN
jgi:hypothetical protein